jgi:hypothetical protein
MIKQFNLNVETSYGSTISRQGLLLLIIIANLTVKEKTINNTTLLFHVSIQKICISGSLTISSHGPENCTMDHLALEH